jgi:hypothetical protein
MIPILSVSVVNPYPLNEIHFQFFLTVANQVDPAFMYNNKQELASQGDFVKYAKLLQLPGKMESGYMTLANGQRAGVSRNAPDVQLVGFGIFPCFGKRSFSNFFFKKRNFKGFQSNF